MGKLFFYSDQIIEENKRIDLELIKRTEKNQIKLGYIPSCGDKNRKYFNKQIDYYSQYNITDFMFLDLDSEFNNELVEELLTCDIIHISGGDPIYCLTNMRKRNFYSVLKEYYLNDGILVGVSGGAVQLGKNAVSFKIFQSSLDEALNEFDNLQTMGVVDFEFLPHYNRWGEEFKDLVKEYSRMVKTTIYACDDGDGIIIDNGTIAFIGTIKKIENGTETTFSKYNFNHI